MPELPEVESYRAKLDPIVRGAHVEQAVLAPANYAFITPPHVIRRKLHGAKLEGLRRHGKYLLLDIANTSCLLIHLGMTGQIFAGSLATGFAPDQHVHMTLTLRGGEVLYFRDPRKFGKLAWIASREFSAEPRLAKLGPDALEIEGEELWSRIKTRKAPIKSVLLDQSVYAGIGNIYADEALFMAGIRPGRAARGLTKQSVMRLAECVGIVLRHAVSLGGSSINDYLLPDGSIGYFQIQHKVYGRAGEQCKSCEGVVKRVSIGSRSSHYCSHCQR